MTSLYLLKIVLTSMGAVTLTILLVYGITIILKNTMPKKIPKKLPYYSEIPFEGDLFYTYSLSGFYGTNPRGTEDFLEALLLKWIKEGKCIVDSQNLDPRESVILFTETEDFRRETEKELYIVLKQSITNNKTTIGDYQRVVFKNLVKLKPILKQIKLRELNKMKKTEIVAKEAKLNMFERLPEKYYTFEYEEEINKLLGFKKYLIDYSIVGFRGRVDNESLMDYLIFAQLLGIETVMTKELANINPLILKEKYDKSVGVNHNSPLD